MGTQVVRASTSCTETKCADGQTRKVRRGMYCCTNTKNTNCQDQLSFPAMQVTSSHVSIWCHFVASNDECTALVKFGDVASEHVK